MKRAVLDTRPAWNAEGWAGRRQRLIDLLGTEAFTSSMTGFGIPRWSDMAQAGAIIGCSPAAARKRLQRNGAALLRVGGRWLATWQGIARLAPGYGFEGVRKRPTTAELAPTSRGRSGRPLSVPGVRAHLKRSGLGKKVGGRWTGPALASLRKRGQ